MSPLNLTQLQCFDGVVREGSFRGAAILLSLSQPSVSMHVSNLEKKLGVQLLHRSAQGTQLTDEGIQMLPHLRSVLRAEEAARQRAASLRGEMEGRVRIGAVSGALATLVPEAVRRTLERHEGIIFEVFQMRAKDVHDRVLDGTIDVGLLLDLTTASFPDMHSELLTHGPVMFVARRGHHLLRRDAVSRGQVAAEPLVMLTPGHLLRDRMLEHFDGYHLRVVGEADSHEAVRRLVAAGVGVTVMPWMTLSSNPGVPSDLRGRPIDDLQVQPGLWMLHLKQTLSRAVETLVDSIRDIVPSTPQ